jgi:hypothetical protein
MASISNANSRAAADWAAKRRLQMERAAQLKAERQASLRGRQLTEDALDMGNEMAAPSYAPTSDREPRRTFSQPTSDLPGVVRGNMPPRRPSTEAGDGELPEWARDFSSNRVDRGAKAVGAAERRMHGADDTFHGAFNGGYAYDEPPSPLSDVPDGAFSYERAPPAAAAYPHAMPAAIANRWPDDMPLGQSDGGIGYNRGRAAPRGVADAGASEVCLAHSNPTLTEAHAGASASEVGLAPTRTHGASRSAPDAATWAR